MSIPQHLMTLGNTLGLPGLPFNWLPLPPQQCLQGYGTRHAPLSLKPSPPPQSFAQSPTKTPTNSLYTLYAGERAFCSSKARCTVLFILQHECFQPGAEESKASQSLGEGAAWLCTPAPPAEIPRVCSAPQRMAPPAPKSAFGATETTSQSPAFFGDFTSRSCL